jgi:hypothetical protein
MRSSSRTGRSSSVWPEQLFCNQLVGGSNPSCGSILQQRIRPLAFIVTIVLIIAVIFTIKRLPLFFYGLYGKIWNPFVKIINWITGLEPIKWARPLFYLTFVGTSMINAWLRYTYDADFDNSDVVAYGIVIPFLAFVAYGIDVTIKLTHAEGEVGDEKTISPARSNVIYWANFMSVFLTYTTVVHAISTRYMLVSDVMYALCCISLHAVGKPRTKSSLPLSLKKGWKAVRDNLDASPLPAPAGFRSHENLSINHTGFRR